MIKIDDFIQKHLTILIISVMIILFPVFQFKSNANPFTLQWDPDDSGTIDGYRMYCRTENETDYDYTAPFWEGSATTYDISGLIAGTRYFFIIRAYNYCGFESINTEEIEIYIDASDDPENDATDGEQNEDNQGGDATTDPPEETTDDPENDMTDDTSDDSTDDSENDSTDGTSDDSTDESTNDSTDGTSDDSTDESTNDSTDGTSDDSTDESTNDSTDSTSDDSTDDSENNNTDSTPDDSTDDSENDNTDGTPDDSTDDSENDNTDGTPDDSTDDSSNDNSDGTPDDSTDESKNDNTDGTPDNSTDEPVNDAIDDTSGDSIDEPANDSANDTSVDPTNETKNDIPKNITYEPGNDSAGASPDKTPGTHTNTSPNPTIPSSSPNNSGTDPIDTKGGHIETELETQETSSPVTKEDSMDADISEKGSEDSDTPAEPQSSSMTLSQPSLILSKNEMTTIYLQNGIPPYHIASNDTEIAEALINGETGEIAVTGMHDGDVTISVSDSTGDIIPLEISVVTSGDQKESEIEDPSETELINTPPQNPIASFPFENANLSTLTPFLETQAFQDKDEYDYHFETRWQISEDKQFSSTIYEITSKTDLTILNVPANILYPATSYYWRAAFADDTGKYSEWSDTSHFMTYAAIGDYNTNGIPDISEVEPEVDLNNDMIPDCDQKIIKSIVVESDGKEKMIGIELSTNVTGIEYLMELPPPSSHNTGPENLLYGFISFKLTVSEPGANAWITVYFSEPVPMWAKWYKYDKRNGWTEYSEHSFFSDDGLSAIVELKDGGFGDADGIENGIIIDPAAVGTTAPPLLETRSEGGCFISSVF